MALACLSAWAIGGLPANGGKLAGVVPRGLGLTAPALSAEAVFDARTGDEIERSIVAGDTHRYRVPIVAGTRIDVRFRSEADDGSDDDASPEKAVVPRKKSEDGPPPTLTIRDPQGAPVASEAGFDSDLRVTAAESGDFEIQVVAGDFAGEYELRIEGELRGVDGGGEVAVTDGPAAFPLEAPLGASVRIEVRRLTGGAPVVTAVRDGLGRDVGFVVKKQNDSRVRLHPIPVTAPGGLDVFVDSAEVGGGTYEVRLRADDDDDDSPDDDDDDREERKIVVQLAAGTDVAALALALKAEFGWELEEVNAGFAVFETPESRVGFEDEDARAAAARFPEILDAEPDARAQTPEGSQSNGVVIGSSLGRSEFDGQPALKTVRAAKAHRRATGTGVVVAVLDSGIDRTHSLFVGRVLPGYDFVDKDDDPNDEQNGIDDDLDGVVDEGFGHGTFVAGLILAAAPGAKILPVRVLDTEGRGRVSDIAAAIQYAKDQGADVINLSFGSRSRSEVVRGAVRLALSHGIAIVSATGNAGDVIQVDFPAGITDVIGVTALDGTGRRAAFANAGGRTALAAPGVDLVGPFPGERWGTWSGTSFSAGLVSGGVALLRERRPAARLQQFLRLFRRRSRAVGRRVPRSERKLLGSGVLNLGKLAR